MGNRKITRKYYFTVDGETEQWYFEWLAKQINCTPDATLIGLLERILKISINISTKTTSNEFYRSCVCRV